MNAPVAPPPWDCRLRAVVRLGVDLGSGPVTALAVIAYADTPVGPYGEALLAQVRLGWPLRVTVPWIVVDSAASAAAGRRHWALPKELATLDLDLDRSSRVHGPDVELQVTARVVGPRLPVRGAAVLQQPGRGPAALRVLGSARPALVRATGGRTAGSRTAGTGPGLTLDGVLRLDAPRPDDPSGARHP